MKKKRAKKYTRSKISNSKLMLLSIILLLIIFEALFIVKDQTKATPFQVAGANTSR